ncbi:unnamed protein product [Heterosigma akashiwo]
MQFQLGMKNMEVAQHENDEEKYVGLILTLKTSDEELERIFLKNFLLTIKFTVECKYTIFDRRRQRGEVEFSKKGSMWIWRDMFSTFLLEKFDKEATVKIVGNFNLKMA